VRHHTFNPKSGPVAFISVPNFNTEEKSDKGFKAGDIILE